MSKLNRRAFLKRSALGAAGVVMTTKSIFSAPTVLTAARASKSTAQGELVFRPYFVQSGRGPHLLDWAYASDASWDAFHSNITASKEGVRISDTGGTKKFGIDVRWNVEGFGYIYITADNGGEFYELPPAGKFASLNLNYELAESRVLRNRRRMSAHTKDGWKPSRELVAFVNISEEYLADAKKAQSDGEKCGQHAQAALNHAMWAAEMMELEKAEHIIARRGYRPDFFIGCDARAFYEMGKDLFMERFTELFNFATITYVVNGDANMRLFEPEEGKLRFEYRDMLHKELREQGIDVEGRLLLWFHKWVTPDWLKKKTYDELLKYVERHTREVVGHYGDGMYGWEIVNELHDWANECQLTPEQTVELTRFACEVAKATAPNVHRVVNNCCPYAEYVQLKEWSGQSAKYPQRTPWKFTKDLVDAGVDFTILGQQMYFPYRDLQDIVILLERFECFDKPLHISEIGASSGPTELSVKLGRLGFPKEPYVWHRHWDEELQADWLAGVYTFAYSKPFITAANWFDFVDPYSYIDNGGLLRSPEGEKKAAYDRLKNLHEGWKRLK